MRDGEEAAEVLQEVSILVLRHAHAPRELENFKAWCRGIARNTLSHYFRSKRRQASLLDRLEPEARSVMAQAPHDPERMVAVRELLDRIFANVDDRSRRMMIDRYLLGCSAKEIAASAEESASAVRMKLMRVRGAVLRTRPCADSWIDPAENDDAT